MPRNAGCPRVDGWREHSEAFSFQVATDDQAETDRAAAKRAFEAMMTIGRIDMASIEAARRG